MDFKLVDIDEIKFALRTRSAESRNLLEMVLKLEKDKKKVVLVSPNGMGLKRQLGILRSRMSYWNKLGQISDHISVARTEDKKIAIAWQAKIRTRKGGRVVDGVRLENGKA